MRSIFKGLSLLLLVAMAAMASAQSLTGTVSGVVKDEQGGALPGVTITLTGKTGAKTAVTGTEGEEGSLPNCTME